MGGEQAHALLNLKLLVLVVVALMVLVVVVRRAGDHAASVAPAAVFFGVATAGGGGRHGGRLRDARAKAAKNSLLFTLYLFLKKKASRGEQRARLTPQ